LTLVALACAGLAGCGPQSATNGALTPTATGQTVDLHFLLDGNFVAANSINDLRFSVVALDPHDGHVAWRHRLETPAPNEADSASLPPLLQDGLIYVGYYYFDPQTEIHHAVLEALEPTTGQTRWRHDVGTGTELSGEPMVVASAVYVSSSVYQTRGQQPVQSGLVEALDRESGTVLWRRALDDPPTMPAALDGRVLVMTSRQFGGHLLALSANDGSIVWDYPSGAPLARGGDLENGWSTAPIVSDHLVYVQAAARDAGGGAQLTQLAINARDGSVAWQYATGGIAATPVLNQSGDILCISTFTPSPTGGASAVTGLAAMTGQVRWSSSPVAIPSACVAAGEIFYLSERAPDGTSGSVLALDSHSGQQLWKASIGALVDADGVLPPAVADGLVAVFLSGPTATPGPVMSTIAALGATDGKLRWRRDFDGRPDKEMDIEGTLIYVPGFAGSYPVLVAYSLDTGVPVWRYALGYA
jgi:outer membrane protein assembly factor BamB